MCSENLSEGFQAQIGIALHLIQQSEFERNIKKHLLKLRRWENVRILIKITKLT